MTPVDKLSRLIEEIHSASLDAQAWPLVIRSLQTHFRCASAGIYGVAHEENEAALLHLENIDSAYVDNYIDRFVTDNPWLRVPNLQAPAAIRTDSSLDEHYNDPGYYRRTSLYNEWMKPQGFVHSLGATLGDHDGVRTKLYLYRGRRAGAYSRKEVYTFAVLTRHLMTAVEVTRRLASTDWLLHGALEATERLRAGVVLLDPHGGVLHANRRVRRLFRKHDGLTTGNGVLGTAHRGDRASLEQALSRALDLRGRRSLVEPETVSLRRPSGKPHLEAIAIPLVRGLHPFGACGAAVAVVVSDPDAQPAFAPKELMERYALTSSEARLARFVVSGMALRDAAAQAGLSYQTARSYLKSIFEKTGTSRQAELVNRLFRDRLPFDVPD